MNPMTPVHHLLSPALSGAAAGLGVAVPMGAMSVLLLQEAVRSRRAAVAGAAGIALVDFAYAALATALGPRLTASLAPAAPWIRLTSATILLTLATHGLRHHPRPPKPGHPEAGTPGPGGAPVNGAAGSGFRGAAPGTGTVAAGAGAEAGATSPAPEPGAAGTGASGGARATGAAGAGSRGAAPGFGKGRGGGSPAGPSSGSGSGTACPDPAGPAGATAPGTGTGTGTATATATATASASAPGTARKAFIRYVGLTAVNPTTALYFVALTTAQGTAILTAPAGAAFAGGVLLASLLWQQLLAAVGAFAGSRISPAVRTWTFRLGYGLIAVYAVKIALPLP
ncbi:hypothetical protein ABZY31_15980 [Streptomyces sp. NPDC006529]|uniref:hypothetical protein n=1 Tax=Streptomyces sp. NPDC006529 TaxID=3157177 RepID=UPI00339DB180